MASLFPQFGNVFGANAPAGRNELVAFNAGKMVVAPSANGKFLITPDLKKGRISLSRGDDQLLHFQWTDRQSGSSPEDFIIFPDDAAFSKVDTGRAGDRVLLLQYKNSARRFFFWMQNKDSSRDDELVKKVNDCMNNVAQSSTASESGGRGAGTGNVQLDHNAIMQMLGAMGDQGRGGAGGQNSVQMAELQNILQNMGLPANQSAVSSPATSAVSSSQASQSGGGSSVAATTASTTHDHDMGGDDAIDEDDDDEDDEDEMTEEEMLRLAIEESMRDANAGAPAPVTVTPGPVAMTPAPAPVAVPTPAQAAPSASGGATITAADLARAMASIQALTNMQQPKSVKLTKLLSPENTAGLLSDEKAVEALIAHLPEGAQNAYELQATLHSPQLRQGVASLVSALQTGNYNAVITNFGLDPTAGADKLAYGDVVGAFLAAIQKWADDQAATGAGADNTSSST